jgi:hypothetical protein
MAGWKRLLEKYGNCDAEEIKEMASGSFETYEVYPNSIHGLSGVLYFLARHDGRKVLIVVGDSPDAGRFIGNEENFGSGKAKICPLDVANCRVLFDVFPFTKPQTQNGRSLSVGLGDRLGLATAGQLQALKNCDVFPVLAQQSIRELKLTGRSYEEVLAAAAFGVFQEGYTRGYGADGDHLKTREEIAYALNCGYTRITLDCSDYIHNNVLSLSEAEIERDYQALPQGDRYNYENIYLNRVIPVKDELYLQYEPASLKKKVLLYHKAIRYMVDIYRELIEQEQNKPDFEISIDETLTETSPEDHFLVSTELLNAGVVFDSLAPRFCGKFEKGIDYIGVIPEFKKDLDAHLKIAQKLGYRLSVHSGSDKFSIFPSIGEKAEGVYHLKTAGTHWLEALRVVAYHAPSLYRRIHQFAMEHLQEARSYYSISADIAKIPDINMIPDSQLPDFLDKDPSRQVLHITYGLILMAKNEDGTSIFKDELYQFLYQNEAQYDAALSRHLKRHLDALNIRN